MPNATPGLTSRHLQALTAVGMRVMADAGPACLDMDISWEDLAVAVITARSRRLIDGGRASEEMETIMALARSAGDPAAREAVSVRFYGVPRLREGFRRLIAVSDTALESRVEAIIARTEAAGLGDVGQQDVHANLDEPTASPTVTRPVGHEPMPGEHEPIAPADLRRLRDHFRGTRDPIELAFAEDHAGMDDLAAATVAEASWATGLRPCEWPDARMLVDGGSGVMARLTPRLDASLDEAAPQLIAMQDRRWDWVNHLRSILLGHLWNGCWLEVPTRKSAPAVSARLPTVRRLGMPPQPPATLVTVFCALEFAKTASEDGMWEVVQRRINRRLKMATKRLFPERRKPLLLYAFRHDFIDRAKGSGMSSEEVQALAGHVSPRSKGHYGRHRHRAASGAVMPTPDPELVAAYVRHAERRRVARRERRASSAAPQASPAMAPR